jgi:transcriptional regulator with XRE-family HTH domain
MNKETFGEKIKRLRTERKWTQGQVAIKSGLSRAHIAVIESRDSSSVDTDTAIKLAHAFDMSVEELYGLENNEKPSATFDDLWERAKLATPIQIPVYSDFKVSLGMVREVPIDYVYYSRQKAGNRNLEAFLCAGYCMVPIINDGDTIVVDVDATPAENDIVLCLANDDLVLGRYKANRGRPFVQNGHGSHSLEGCQRWGVVVGVYRSLK